MTDAPNQDLLEALLDSWDRNNSILLNLLRALPEGGLEAKAMEGSPSVAQLFTHIHFVRLVFVFEDAPEFARDLPVTSRRLAAPCAGLRARASSRTRGAAATGSPRAGP